MLDTNKAYKFLMAAGMPEVKTEVDEETVTLFYAEIEEDDDPEMHEEGWTLDSEESLNSNSLLMPISEDWAKRLIVSEALKWIRSYGLTVQIELWDTDVYVSMDGPHIGEGDSLLEAIVNVVEKWKDMDHAEILRQGG